MSMSYQSTDAEKPCMAPLGCQTRPNVTVSAFSGSTFGLPPVRLDVWISTPLLAGSVTVAPPAVASKRSRIFAARTSRDFVARRRSESIICQLRPYFHDEIEPEPVYVAQR